MSDFHDQTAGYIINPASHPASGYIGAPQQLPNFATDTGTRKFCSVGLVTTFIGSVAAFTAAGILYRRQKVIYNDYTNEYDQSPIGFASTATKEGVSLLLNFYITACTESLGFVHAASLRWALYHEGRLKYNSNLRLFTSARESHANGRVANFLWAASLALSYASVSQFTLPNDPQSAFPHYIFCPSPLVILGASLLCQGVLAIWCLVPSKRRRILSWNSSPLNTTLAYCHMNGIRHSDFRVALPSPRQHSAFKYVPHMQQILVFLWSLVPITALWGVLIWFLAVKDLGQRDTSFSATDDTGGFYPGTYNLDENSAIAVNTLIVGLMQIVYTLGFHAAEQVVNASRDEEQWRKAANLDKGVAIGANSVTAAFTSWKTLTLLVLKPIGHWIFGFSCVSFWYGWLAFHPIPIFCLSGIALLLSVFSTAIVFHQPTGPQPSTYGNLQFLSIFIDNWGKEDHGRLYWGDKGAVLDLSNQVVRAAGTSETAERLQPIRMQELYSGLQIGALD